MKPKLTHSFLAKTVAVVLFLAFALAALATGFCVVCFTADGYYEGVSAEYEESTICSNTASDYARSAFLAYFYSQEALADEYATAPFIRRIDPANTNFRYTITDGDGTLLAGNVAGIAVGERVTTYLSTYEFESGPAGRQEVIVEGYLTKALAVDDIFAREKAAFDALYPARYTLVAALAASLFVCILLFVFLMCAAGRHSDSEAIRAGVLDRIPYDLYLVGAGTLVTIAFGIAASVSDSMSLLTVVAIVFAFLLGTLAILALCMTTAARIKLRTFWHNMVISWCLRKLAAFFRHTTGGLAAFWCNRKLLARVLFVLFGVGALDIILLLSAQHDAFPAFLFMAFNACVIVFSCRVALGLQKLLDAGKRLAGGDFSQRLDTAEFFGGMKQHAESLNSIQVGVSHAVDERMKSERMKTDLITNVSHDLKTPLTSIVNYVDLLKKEDLHNETADEYVAVLDRQAERLKKLTIDLVEASKASSGTINAVLAPTNVAEAVNQSLAEYAERFEKANLTPVVTVPEEGLSVIADGRLLWRALDNLLSNVVKYSQSGTRVYIDALTTGNNTYITVKNISREQLNIPAEDLMERFVRGDASRATEGSGLGLSIARCLVELMHGKLTLSISGDLFTAEISLPAVL